MIPGGEVTLGWDRASSLTLSEPMERDWEWTSEEYGLSSIHEFLAENTTPLRTVSFSPFLVETVVFKPPAKPKGKKAKPSSTDESMFRMPTVDEWEYVCSAGSRTLWRWGNECPMVGTPYDYVPERGVILGDRPAFNKHIERNAFGLSFPADSYRPETVLREDGTEVPRSGDGGGMNCGGAGVLACWLTLATPVTIDTIEIEFDHFGEFRSVFTIPDEILGNE